MCEPKRYNPMDLEVGLSFQPVDPMYIGRMDMRDLVQSVIDYKDYMAQIAEKQEDAKEVYKKLEAELIRRYDEEEQTGGVYVDAKTGRKKTISVVGKLNPIATFSYSDELVGLAFKEMIKSISDQEGNTLEYLLDRTPGEIMKSFRGIAKEIYEQNERELPEKIAKFVEMRTEYSIGMRTK